jgi:hypothetical protein
MRGVSATGKPESLRRLIASVMRVLRPRHEGQLHASKIPRFVSHYCFGKDARLYLHGPTDPTILIGLAIVRRVRPSRLKMPNPDKLMSGRIEELTDYLAWLSIILQCNPACNYNLST